MQVRSFVFTWNNYDDKSIEVIKAAFHDAKYLVIGKEKGDSGTPHLQGYIQLDKRLTIGKIGKMFPWHVEPTRGTPTQASVYCKKEGDYVELGELSTPDKGKREREGRWTEILQLAKKGKFEHIELNYPSEYIRNLRSLHQIRVENLPEIAEEKTCLWIYGKPGTGKSLFSFDFDRDSSYAKTANKWWDGYKGHNTIILDDLGIDHRVLGYHLKRWADRYPCVLEVKGTALMAAYHNFIVTSNYSVNDIFDDDEMKNAILRRFIMINCEKYHINLEGMISIYDNLSNRWINKFNYQKNKI